MNKIPERCNDRKELNKLVRVMLELALGDIRSQGVNPLIVETYRSQTRQNYLYCQGRTIIEVTSKGISSSFAKAYCCPKADKITWTLHSVHRSRKAVDVVPQRMINGKMTAIWNSQDPQTQIIIKTMQKYGFEAGANWRKSPDSPHFQVKGNFTNVFDTKHTTPWVTEAIQKALDIEPDCIWGSETTASVNIFRKSVGYKTAHGQIGSEAFKVLFNR